MSRRFAAMAALLLALAGCVQPQVRPQMPDEAERDRDLSVRTIGAVTEVGNVEALQVSGVGLVTGLDGTGHAPQGWFRSRLEEQLRKHKSLTDRLLRAQGVGSVKALLDSPNNALVLVAAFIPPGARRGDRLDVEITLPQGSRATSLAGGTLEQTILKNYESTRTLNPDSDRPDRLVTGHTLALARGRLALGTGAPTEDAGEQRAAHVWQGGISLIDRPFVFVMKNDSASTAIANAVAQRINLTFQEDPRRLAKLSEEQKRLVLLGAVSEQINQKFEGVGRGEMAKAAGKGGLHVRVPLAYRFNPQRYLIVARNTPLRSEPPEVARRYRSRLQKMLVDPKQTLRAAVRLETLGKESVPAFKEGLTHAHPLVRFACAESLTYLGSTAGVEELTRLARRHALLTNHCVIALASLDEAVCHDALGELMRGDDPAVRCGAFMAHRLASEGAPAPRRDSQVRSEHLAEAFWLHRVAPGSAPLVHYGVGNRAEVVLFGNGVAVRPPVRMLVGREFTVTAEGNDVRCTVSRMSPHNGGAPVRRQCGLDLDEVLRTLAELGGSYADVIDLLRKIEERNGLSCPIRVNCLPPEVSFEQLAEEGPALTDAP